MIVIGAVGLNGSGKDALIEYLRERHGIPMLSMGDLVRDIAAQRDVEPTRGNLHELSQEAIEQHGRDYFAKKLIAQIEQISDEVVGVTGIRTPADVKTLREHFGDDFVLVHVRVGNPRTRFARVRERDEARDPESYDRFLRQDREEAEMYWIEETIEQADITIDNDGSLEDFHRAIKEQVVKPVLSGEEQH